MQFSQIRNEVFRLEEEAEREGHVTPEQRMKARELLAPHTNKATKLAAEKNVPDVDALVEIDDAEGRRLIMKVREIYGKALEGETDAMPQQKTGFQPDPRLK